MQEHNLRTFVFGCNLRSLRANFFAGQIGDVIGAVACFVLNVDLHVFNSAY